jgi:hypothetical protein
MLLTSKQQAAHQGYKPVHEYLPPTPPTTSRFSPAPTNAGLTFPQSISAHTSILQEQMSTPHRGLPPPAAMTLPPGPSSMGQPPQLGQSLGPLPPPPQWQGHGGEEAMRSWLMAKAEEEKRRAEEERTKQESLRLEQRRVDHQMLERSLNAQMPVAMIPLLFAGGSGPAVEAAHNYVAHMNQMHQVQQQQHQQQALPAPPSESRRESFYGGSQHQHPAPAPPHTVRATGQQPQSAGFIQSYPQSPSRSRPQFPQPPPFSRLPAAADLPKINTGDPYQQSAQGTSVMHAPPGQSAHSLQHGPGTNPAQQETQSSPLFIHHWQPPSSQAGSSGANQPSTPSGISR